MRIRQTCAYMLMTGGILLFAGGAAQADQSKSGSKSGTQSDSTMGSGSGSGSGTTGGSSGTMKQGHESSGKMGKDSSVITEDNPGGIVTRGGRGEMNAPSKVDPLKKDQRDDLTKSGPGGVAGSQGSSGNTGSSGSMGSSGGTGSSGGGGGY